jgi:hypothetical protein
MEAVNIRIGPLTFDHADYDEDGGILYLHLGPPQPGEGEETPEGHVIRFAPGSQQIVGLTVINARHALDRVAWGTARRGAAAAAQPLRHASARRV